MNVCCHYDWAKRWTQGGHREAGVSRERGRRGLCVPIPLSDPSVPKASLVRAGAGTQKELCLLFSSERLTCITRKGGGAGVRSSHG